MGAKIFFIVLVAKSILTTYAKSTSWATALASCFVHFCQFLGFACVCLFLVHTRTIAKTCGVVNWLLKGMPQMVNE